MNIQFLFSCSANNIKNENVLDSLGGNFAGIASFVGLPRGDKDNNDFELLSHYLNLELLQKH